VQDVVRILLVQQDRLLRESLAAALGQHGLEVVGSASDLATAMEYLRASMPDVLVIDVAHHDAPAVLIRTISLACPQISVLAIGVPDSAEQIIRCIEAGAIGYVLGDASLSDLVSSIMAAAHNESLASPRLTASLCRRLTSRAIAQASVDVDEPHLTGRQREIIALIVAGYPNKEIARCLGIAAQTVKNHVHTILEKLQLPNRYEIARRAHAAGMILKPRSSAAWSRLPPAPAPPGVTSVSAPRRRVLA
jgi:two-component system, NarL family, nitrate/nitrite response regulator NarL